MVGVEVAEVGAEFFVGGLVLLNVPDASVVAEEGECGSGFFDAGFECGAGEGESAAL